ncbi:MAG TPA: hypothetical protein VGE24_08050 [Emticicia sp.]
MPYQPVYVPISEFYLLFLASLPCDNTSKYVAETKQTIVRSDTDSQASHGVDSDFCSPLFSSACCGSRMIIQVPVSKLTYRKVKFPYKTKDASSFISLPW